MTEKSKDRFWLLLIVAFAIAIVSLLVNGSNKSKQYELYKQKTDSLFATQERAYEAQLEEGSRSRDSLRFVIDDLVRDTVRLGQNERALVKKLSKVSREKYQSMSALEKQNEMIKRARE